MEFDAACDSVEVHCDGGTVTVQWDGQGGVVLTGSVEPIMHGIAMRL
jgi:diaminopimelate epimerase